MFYLIHLLFNLKILFTSASNTIPLLLLQLLVVFYILLLSFLIFKYFCVYYFYWYVYYYFCRWTSLMTTLRLSSATWRTITLSLTLTRIAKQPLTAWSTWSKMAANAISWTEWRLQGRCWKTWSILKALMSEWSIRMRHRFVRLKK